MSGNSRSREFPGIPASNSRPESREWNLPLAFPFPKMGMEFSICIPVPVNGNEIFLGFPGNSREFSVPESREWNFLFICIPVPENGNGICHSHSHSRSRKWEWNLPFPVPVPEVQKSFPLMAALHLQLSALHLPCLFRPSEINQWFPVLNLK